MELVHVLAPLSDTEALEVRKVIREYWDWMNQCDDLSGTLGGQIREVEVKVTELLETRRASDVYEAFVLTVQIELLLRRIPS